MLQTDEIELVRRDHARRSLDAAEYWLRRIISLLMKQKFGDDFLDAKLPNGDAVLGVGRLQQMKDRFARDKQKFPSIIDAAMFEDVIAIVLHPNLYKDVFRDALSSAYPDGVEEARTFLGRMLAHRNALSHGGVCSIRMAEQCSCYSNDLIDSLKSFLAERNMERQFNVPMFTRFKDSFGNDLRFNNDNREHVAFDARQGGKARDIEVGETLILEVEVDESFAADAYELEWRAPGLRSVGPVLKFQVAAEHVGQALTVSCILRSKKEWHRLGNGNDDVLHVLYRVLPPH